MTRRYRFRCAAPHPDLTESIVGSLASSNRRAGAGQCSRFSPGVRRTNWAPWHHSDSSRRRYTSRRLFLERIHT